MIVPAKPTIDPTAMRKTVMDRIAQSCSIIRREQWGARPPVHPLDPDWRYDAIVVHYSGHDTYSMRAIQDLDIDHRHWDDFAYHYAVGKDGRIFEGRELIYKASHLLHQNTGKIGIVCLGDFDASWRNLFAGRPYAGDAIDMPMLVSLKRLSMTLQATFPIRTFGGHKEYGLTDVCPGSNLLPKVIAMRTELGLQAPVFRNL